MSIRGSGEKRLGKRFCRKELFLLSLIGKGAGIKRFREGMVGLQIIRSPEG